MIATKKRKLDSAQGSDNGKRLKMTPAPGPSVAQPPNAIQDTTKQGMSVETTETLGHSGGKNSITNEKAKGKPDVSIRPSTNEKTRPRIRKLVPPRPFPTVPTSVSATGPRSSHREGKNMICLTRKTSLGNYMRRCKEVILVDGYKTLHLSAMGAAIPLLTQLICALPPILPFGQDEIQTEITTGTIDVQDEVMPEDDDEDLAYQTRSKSVLSVVFKIGDGKLEGDRTASRKYSGGKTVGKNHGRPARQSKNDIKGKGKAPEESELAVVFEEPEQEYMDML
ncbi:hypothetical protein GALMADRAFT_240120 [Galerina marginata CBS 339.88]|uniref:Uncharacterized protein n=1 Tax=Galerina marginata (strain CBS 339.88) TaxID=685588 RepID=A0A067TSD2_GALM3|nr:hypothetical protein GALMADRAFT_240120 [Galerina marginata CBS 339.88]